MTQAAIRYRIGLPAPQHHRFDVALTVDRPGHTLTLSLPVWIPGSYLVREFAQHIQSMRAQAADGQPLQLEQTGKNEWVLTGLDDTPSVTVHLDVYAFDPSVRTAYLDPTRGFFNPTSLCLRVHGRDHEACDVQIERGPGIPPSWHVATALPPHRVDDAGWGHYRAHDYDELADSPVALGPGWQGQFTVHGVPHHWFITGVGPGFDGERLLRDSQRIAETVTAFWHGPEGRPPFGHYRFLLHASQDGYGGLEHRHSTALLCQRSDLPTHGQTGAPSAGYTTLLGLIAHEYFHAWHVKRLRPAEFRRYDYDRENLTRLLWLFEGFTSYYDDLLVHRAGLIDRDHYLQQLTRTLQQVWDTPGRHWHSLAQASLDAWTRYYRPHANTPNSTVSYYTKGALVALCLDLRLRQEGHAPLDAVMRELYARCAAGPMEETDLLAVLQRQTGRSWAPELQAWVHGTEDLPVTELLATQGIHTTEQPSTLTERLGIRLQDGPALTIRHVMRGSVAEAAGLSPGDEWIGIWDPTAATNRPLGWRVRTAAALNDWPASDALTVLVSRDGELLSAPIQLSKAVPSPLPGRLALSTPTPAASWPTQ